MLLIGCYQEREGEDSNGIWDVFVYRQDRVSLRLGRQGALTQRGSSSPKGLRTTSADSEKRVSSE
jgi:hypothetical protein